jgi:hypothetical protein
MRKHCHGMALARAGTMWLEAIFTKADLEMVLAQFSPLKILLGDNGSLLLAEPTEVVLIPDEGIGVVCDVTLHWPVLGFDVPVAFRGLTVRILPVVEVTATGTPLVFRVQLDHTGMAILPSILDHRVTAMVNEELQKKHVELSWNFMETLTHEFRLPAAIASAASISLVAVDGMAKATSKALGLAVRFETAVRRRPAAGEAEATPAIPALEGGDGPDGGASTSNGAPHLPPARPLPEAFDVRSFVVGGAVAAMAFTTIGGLARLFGRDRHRSW